MSLKRDYILSMIEQIELFLARLSFLRESDRASQAAAEIDEFYRRVTELGRDELHALSIDELRTLFLDEGTPDISTSLAVASVLKEEGEGAVRAEMPDEAAAAYSRSLALLLDIYATGAEALPLGTIGLLEYVIDMARRYEIPEIVARPLMAYYERVGLYADAEDILFEIIGRGNPDALAEGEAFYDRLSARDDHDLIDGGLPREEIEEGRNALRQMSTSGGGSGV